MEATAANGQRSWLRVAVAAAVALAVCALAVAATARDPESAVIGLGFGLAALLLRLRWVRLGSLLLAVLCLDVLAWLVPAAYSNATHGDGAGAIALPVTLVTIAIVGLVALVGRLVRAPARAIPTVLATAAILGVAAVVAPVALGAGEDDRPQPGDVRISTRRMAFSTDDLAVDAGEVGVAVTNRDLFWHTFTVRDLDVDVKVPVHGTRRATFDAPPGTYEFVCVIPGHEGAGMTGTLVVRASAAAPS